MREHKKIILHHSRRLPAKMRLGSMRKNHTQAKRSPVDISKIGYIPDIFCLHHLHFPH